MSDCLSFQWRRTVKGAGVFVAVMAIFLGGWLYRDSYDNPYGKANHAINKFAYARGLNRGFDLACNLLTAQELHLRWDNSEGLKKLYRWQDDGKMVLILADARAVRCCMNAGVRGDLLDTLDSYLWKSVDLDYGEFCHEDE